MNEYKSLFSLEGKVAIITGGAGLLGKETAKGLCDFGAKTVVADISLDKAQAVVDGLQGVATAEFIDISDEKSVEDLISKYEKIDIWINNAYPRTADWGVKFENIPVQSWRQNVDMHLNGYFICCQKAAQKMREVQSGTIINIASIYGMLGPDFSIYQGTNLTMPAAYSAIKGGIINLTRYLATYLAADNIRVNCISPGGIFDNQQESFVTAYCNRTPMARMACPRDIAGPILFLSSNASSYITGQNLIADGGWTAW
ncbi:MAG: short-chain dehydrogenase [Firmicutes bacterium HGW-Firmicutes-14]|jgi:NAD(P)-dependent dehydrogenase (short-subunit alcohol dehydrogenase family)|nr:MAG: short-chain dehydrogenase [Firmicutes bacterium HGW-Firmicutes-14]